MYNFDTLAEARDAVEANGFVVETELVTNVDRIMREYYTHSERDARAEITVIDGNASVSYFTGDYTFMVQLDRAKVEQLLHEEENFAAEMRANGAITMCERAEARADKIRAALAAQD